MDWQWIIGSSLMIGAIIGGIVGLYYETKWTPPVAPIHVHRWEPYQYPTDEYGTMKWRCIGCWKETENWENYHPNNTGYTGWADR